MRIDDMTAGLMLEAELSKMDTHISQALGELARLEQEYQAIADRRAPQQTESTPHAR
jgi:hypothetical protein